MQILVHIWYCCCNKCSDISAAYDLLFISKGTHSNTRCVNLHYTIQELNRCMIFISFKQCNELSDCWSFRMKNKLQCSQKSLHSAAYIADSVHICVNCIPIYEFRFIIIFILPKWHIRNLFQIRLFFCTNNNALVGPLVLDMWPPERLSMVHGSHCVDVTSLYNTQATNVIMKWYCQNGKWSFHIQ